MSLRNENTMHGSRQDRSILERTMTNFKLVLRFTFF